MMGEKSKHKLINGHEYLLYGPNKTIYEWSKNSRLGKKIFQKAGIKPDLIKKALGASIDGVRINTAIDIIN